MGGRRIRGVRFQAYSADHAGAAVPHLHAKIGSGEVIVELLPDGKVRISESHGKPVRGKISSNERHWVLWIAEDAYDDLIILWRRSQP